MGVLIYTSDMREQDGQVMSAEDIKNNLTDVQDVANAISSENIRKGALDQFHLLDGEPLKQSLDGYRHVDFVGPLYHWTFVSVVHIPDVRVGDFVYVVGSVSYNQSENGTWSYGDSLGALRLISGDPAEGSWELTGANGTNHTGGANIVWAFRAQSGGSKKVSLQHYTKHGWPNTTSASGVDYVVRAQLVVFVVDR